MVQMLSAQYFEGVSLVDFIKIALFKSYTMSFTSLINTAMFDVLSMFYCMQIMARPLTERSYDSRLTKW